MSWGANIVGVGRVLDLFEDIGVEWGGEALYIVGTNVEYAVHLETGTADRPAYPWVRPAIADYNRDPGAFIARNTDVSSLGDLGGLEDLVKTVAFAFERQLKINVNARNDGAGPSGRRSPGTNPDHPGVDTGNLINSIRAEQVR